MRVVDIIEKKRDGQELGSDEIEFLMDSYMNEEVPDYQMSAFMMAVYFKGMSRDELKLFTEKMMHSGELIKIDGVDKFIIDKHSTGGVGDKTTIALAPIFASFGIGTAKLSGRGLGHTGGTIDKFESITGFLFPATRIELAEMINKTGIGIMGYTDTVVPLDKKLYSLRDVTGTVPSIPLIASSIMSKKLAVYSDGIILDVKVGSGAFMKDMESARELAKTMLEIGDGFGRKVKAVLSNMDQPLGFAVGNSLEVIEAIETLKGKGPWDLTYLVGTLAAIGLQMKGEVSDIEEGRRLVEDMIKSGKPLKKLKEFIEMSGGDPYVVEDYSLLPVAESSLEVVVEMEGYVSHIEADLVGKSAMVLGAGREKKGDEIDPSVGVVLEKKIGDKVEKGDTLAKIYYCQEKNLELAKKMLIEAYSINPEPCEKSEVIFEIHSVNI